MSLYKIYTLTKEAQMECLFAIKACVDSGIEPDLKTAQAFAGLADELFNVTNYIDNCDHWKEFPT